MENTSPKAKGLALTPATVVLNSVLFVIAGYWFHQVTNVVPSPYLDEVFHVRQALEYWAARWHVWDPKITTPPGLYAVSYIWLWLLRSLDITWSLVTQLRSLNVVTGVFVLYHLSRQLLHLIPLHESASTGPVSGTESSQARPSRALDHAALNMCLFPPLFFFYALYYTDVLSVALVLIAYGEFHRRRTLGVVVASVLALTFRQTNIFWTAIYLGGLEVVRNLKKGRSGVEFPREPNFVDVATDSWQHGCLYDPLISEASFEDYLKTGISLSIATLANLRRLLPLLLPYLSLLFAFTTFVLWNGGVVLGDKSNHRPHLHLPQLLYLGPYTALFSFPLYYPYLLNLLPHHLVPPSRRTGPTRPLLPRLTPTLPLVAVMLLVVRSNTVVHPFTLADNRHYTFYVFRHLRRHWSFKYVPVPLYLITGWCCAVVLGGYPVNQAHVGAGDVRGPDTVKREDEKATGQVQAERRDRPPGNRASFLVLFLATTALSVVTAPLVEPRYFILPWLVWRLHVPRESGARSEPASPPHDELRQRTDPKSPKRTEPKKSTSWLARNGYDYRLHLETFWFLLVNGATGYIFLNWDFTWPLEEGSQRFMW